MAAAVSHTSCPFPGIPERPHAVTATPGAEPGLHLLAASEVQRIHFRFHSRTVPTGLPMGSLSVGLVAPRPWVRSWPLLKSRGRLFIVEVRLFSVLLEGGPPRAEPPHHELWTGDPGGWTQGAHAVPGHAHSGICPRPNESGLLRL